MTDSTVLRGRVISAAHLLDDGIVTVRGQRIEEVLPFNVWRARHPRLAEPEYRGLVLPGLVDIHVHGGGGYRFDTESPAEAEAAARFHHARGTTTVLASLVTGSAATMLAQVTALRKVAAAGFVAGIHAEGPFLSPARHGAQDPRHLREPDLDLVDRMLAAADGHLRVVTLAPELPGYREAARRLREAGVVVALGHSDADYEVFRAALPPDGDATLVTHLANAMPPLHHRAPGPVAAALHAAATTSAVVEVIGDGVHIDPGFAALAFAAAPERVALVTDAIQAAGMPDGRYRLGEREIAVRAGVAGLPDGCLAGSTATLLECLRWAVRGAGLPLRAAVLAATSVPARAAGLREVGDLRADRLADLVILDDDLELHGVLRHGQWLT
ncbi:N-acetylglucosamine-6-phosphate deacetylase [Nocardia takedensis]